MPHPLKLVKAIQNTEIVARVLYEVRCGSYPCFDPWPKVLEETREAYRQEARTIREKLGIYPGLMPNEEVTAKAKTRVTFIHAFTLGVLYASPQGEHPQSFHDMVSSEARKLAATYVEDK